MYTPLPCRLSLLSLASQVWFFACLALAQTNKKLYTTISPSDFLDELVGEKSKYDTRIRPNFKGPPVNVNVSILMHSIGSISSASMDFKINIFLRQRWNDPRLEYHNYQDPHFAVDASLLESFWRPSMFFSNEKAASFHHADFNNHMLRLFRNGDILYSTRLTLTLGCNMDLRYFPMDTQVCRIIIESYGYSTEDLLFQWEKHNPVQVDEQLELPQFMLHRLKTGTCTSDYTTGSFSCIEAILTLKREMGYYLIQLYIPCILIVILSWVSFWIHHDSAPARVALGITTVLTMTTQSGNIGETLPKVSYVKAIDIWISTCLIFVFAALLEYAIVNVLARQCQDIFAGCGRSRRKPHFTIDPESRAITKDAVHHRCLRYAQRVDTISRIAFPIVFMFFNLFYWLTFIALRN
uniref:glycine receptor subunit alpha-2-like isoform X1 n=2 Tax=Myxine glutinosa TaxID=7769 RepID=UPI00358EF523